MTITIAFVVVVGAILGTGTAYRRWEATHRVRFGDEAGSHTATWALARVEARELLRHPTWLIALTVVTLITTLLIFVEEDSTIAANELPWFAFIGLPMAGLALVVSAHRLATRSRRAGMEELEASTPTAPRARTQSLLLASLAPLAVVVVYLVVDLVVTWLTYDPMPHPTVGLLLPLAAFAIPVVGGSVVGVLLARWLPFTWAALFGVVAVLVLNNGVDHLHPRYRWLRPTVEETFAPFDVERHAWHLTFLVALVLLGAALALWRHPGTPWLRIGTVAAVAAVVAGGWAVTRGPTASELAAVVDRLERPAAHLDCGRRGVATYCVHPGAGSFVDAWAPAVDAVVAQVPDDAQPDAVEVVQRLPVGLHDLLPAVRDAVDPSVVWAADGAVHPGYAIQVLHPDLPVAWQTAALVVGLPPATSWDHPTGCMAGGQARLVLAHLLAARATPSTTESFVELARSVRERQPGSAAVAVDLEYDYLTESEQPEGRRPDRSVEVAADGTSRRQYVAYAGASGYAGDIAAAEALLGLDRAHLDDLIATHWDELVEPTTPTSRIVSLAGLGDGTVTATPTAVLAAPMTHLDDPRACP